MNCELIQRITNYLAAGGLVNPELMEHEKVRDLLIDCRDELAKPEQEPLANEKEGSPCPEFWDWLPKAYNFAGNGVFTKYNMEVAFLAGKQFSSTAPPRTSIEHAVIAGVLYDFMGWLTSRRARLCLSDKDNASPAVDAIVDFAKMRGLNLEDAQVERWQAILTTPHSAKGSTDSAETFGKPEQAEKQEPVGEIICEDLGRPFSAMQIRTHFFKSVPPVGTKLYTAPPRKEWVGLTDEELVEIRETHQAHIFQLMFAVEAKIREKNNAI